jgi:hypothetical protein
MPGAPPSASISMPESSASAGNPAPFAVASAFSRAFAAKLSPVSSGSSIPSSAADTSPIPSGLSKSRNSAILPLLWLASTSLPPAAKDSIISRP